jgi:hypothetical protein
MTEIVNIRGAVVSVRDDLAARVIVCTRCKGFKTVMVRDLECWNCGPYLWFWMGHEERCPQCSGRGLFYEVGV